MSLGAGFRPLHIEEASTGEWDDVESRYPAPGEPGRDRPCCRPGGAPQAVLNLVPTGLGALDALLFVALVAFVAFVAGVVVAGG